MGSPPADRIIMILDFLTTHSGRGFTLAELCRQLGISKATGHAVLGSLTERAVVLRNPDTFEYRLGPALVPMGAAAERGFPALTNAKREAERLAAEYDTDCIVVMTTGPEILTLASAGVGGPSIRYVVGQRRPFVPPWGTVFLAWSTDEAVEAWLGRLGPELTDVERDHHRDAVAAARDRGFAIVTHVPQFDDTTVEGVLRLGSSTALAHDLGYVLAGTDLPPDSSVGAISAPIFGPDGSVLLAIALVAGDAYRAKDIPVLSRAVVHGAERVTASVDGRRPRRRRAVLDSRSAP